jgi:3-oxoacyl-[acyl-carrier protein] reductase
MQTVIVTGAAGGMGEAIVKKLIAQNYAVAGIDIVEKPNFSHPNYTYVQGSAIDPNIMTNFVATIQNVYGVVNALGMAQAATPIEDVSYEQWDRLMGINVKSLFISAKATVAKLKAQQNGVIINIASISAVRPRPGLQAYIASKGAAESFSRALAIELAPFNIRVNTIHPGPAATPMLNQFVQAGANVEASREQIFVQSVPLGRLIEPQDIANSVAFLLSEEASIITGTTLHVDGGRGL